MANLIIGYGVGVATAVLGVAIGDSLRSYRLRGSRWHSGVSDGDPWEHVDTPAHPRKES